MRFATGNRKGQTAIMFTLAAVPLFGILGLVVDIGWAYYRKQAAQTCRRCRGGRGRRRSLRLGRRRGHLHLVNPYQMLRG